MAAYLIADIEITDPEAFERYRTQVPATIAAHGGRYLVRGGALDAVEGDWNPKRLVVLEFPSMERLRKWYESPEYQPLLALRLAATVSKTVTVEGIG